MCYKVEFVDIGSDIYCKHNIKHVSSITERKNKKEVWYEFFITFVDGAIETGFSSASLEAVSIVRNKLVSQLLPQKTKKKENSKFIFINNNKNSIAKYDIDSIEKIDTIELNESAEKRFNLIIYFKNGEYINFYYISLLYIYLVMEDLINQLLKKFSEKEV